MMGDLPFAGWAVAAAAVKDTPTQFKIRVRPFTIATFHKEDAERYARDEVAKDFPPDDGWMITVSAMPIRLITVEPSR